MLNLNTSFFLISKSSISPYQHTSLSLLYLSYIIVLFEMEDSNSPPKKKSMATNNNNNTDPSPLYIFILLFSYIVIKIV